MEDQERAFHFAFLIFNFAFSPFPYLVASPTSNTVAGIFSG
jgi:hypothetical protein